MPNAFGYMPAKDFTLCCFIQISCCPAVFSIIQDIRPVFRFFGAHDDKTLSLDVDKHMGIFVVDSLLNLYQRM